MIVVDTNTIAYLYLPTPHTESVERLLALGEQWAAPKLWRSEFRNILALYVRKEILSIETACQIQDQAETLMAGNEYDVNSLSVMLLAHRTSCSAYDCEFASLAQSMETKLITADKKLRNAFSDLAVTAAQYISTV